MHSFQPQPRQQGGRMPSAGGTEPSPSLELPFHLPETAEAASPLVPLTSPRDPAQRMGPRGVWAAGWVQAAGWVRAASCPHLPPPRVLQCKMHPPVEDAPSSYPRDCAAPLLTCLGSSEWGKWGVCRWVPRRGAAGTGTAAGHQPGFWI